MFCPKCGIQNPETGKFCRSCGTDLGNVSDVLTGKLQIEQGCGQTRRGRPITLESAMTKLFMGLAFIIIAVILGVSGKGSGWWFWMLIPGLIFVAGGAAQYIQLRSARQSGAQFASADPNSLSGSMGNAALPPQQTQFVSPESRYKTGDLVPPSVTDSTTRHLEVNSEGETMTLPKR